MLREALRLFFQPLIALYYWGGLSFGWLKSFFTRSNGFLKESTPSPKKDLLWNKIQNTCDLMEVKDALHPTFSQFEEYVTECPQSAAELRRTVTVSEIGFRTAFICSSEEKQKWVAQRLRHRLAIQKNNLLLTFELFQDLFHNLEAWQEAPTYQEAWQAIQHLCEQFEISHSLRPSYSDFETYRKQALITASTLKDCYLGFHFFIPEALQKETKEQISLWLTQELRLRQTSVLNTFNLFSDVFRNLPSMPHASARGFASEIEKKISTEELAEKELSPLSPDQLRETRIKYFAKT